MRRKPLQNLDAIAARAADMCLSGENVKTIRAAIRAEYGASVTYAEISEWTHDAQAERRVSGNITTMLMVLFPGEYDYTQPGRLPFATLRRPHENAQPWVVYRSPMFGHERRYDVVPASGAPFAIWSPTLAGWIETMRRRGYRIQAIDPDEQECEQVELFSGRVAA